MIFLTITLVGAAVVATATEFMILFSIFARDRHPVDRKPLGETSPISSGFVSKPMWKGRHRIQKSRLTGAPVADLEQIERYAEAGDSAAQFELGWMYENGVGVPRSGTDAIRWYLMAARAGVVQAQLNLGWIYQNGRGIERDMSKSEMWYRRAVERCRRDAENGDAASQLSLGWMYESGEAVERDYGEATRWFRKAAVQGCPRARFDLAEMYYRGFGVEEDLAEAYKWFRLSGAEGWGRCLQDMSPEQIAEGERRIAAFQEPPAPKWDAGESPFRNGRDPSMCELRLSELACK